MLRLLRYLIILIVLVVALGLGAFFLTPSSTVLGMVASQIEDATGRDVEISDRLERRLYPTLGFTVGPASISAPEWAEDDAPMVEIEEARLDLDLMALLRGSTQITELVLTRPVLRVEVRDGRGSWEMDGGSTGGGGSDGGASGGGDMAISIADARIVDGEIHFTDHDTGQTIQVVAFNANGGVPSSEAALTLDATAEVNGEDVSFALDLDSLGALQRGEELTIDLELTAPGLDARLTGRADPGGDAGPSAAGSGSIALSEDRDLTAWLRSALPPAAAELGALTLEARYDVSDAAVDVTIEGSGDLRGRPASFDLTAAGGAGWRDGATPIDVDLDVRNDLVAVGFDGSARAPADAAPEVQGSWSLASDDAQALLAFAGAAPAETDPLARLSAMDLSGVVEMTEAAADLSASGSVEYGERRIDLDAGLSGGDGWRAGEPVETRLSATSDALFTLDWTGVARLDDGAPSAVDGRLAFATDALRELALWSGGAPVDAPPGTFEAAAFDADVALETARIALSDMALTLDDASVEGDLAVDNVPVLGAYAGGAQPRVTADLSAGDVDLRPFIQGGPTSPSGGEASAGAGGGAGWGEDPFQLLALRLVDASIDLEFDGLATNVIRLGRSSLSATLEGGALEIAIAEMGLYGGQAAGTLSLDGSTDVLGVATDLEVSGVALLPFMTDVGGLTWLDGTGAATARITGRGEHMQALMDSLGGSASMALTDGAIVGYNLAAMVRNLTGQGGGDAQRTDFASITASFSISNGVASNSDLEFLGPLLRMTGEGVIDIGGQSIDYLARPSAVATLEGQGGDAGLRGLTFPIRIRGPWSDPSVAPDLSAGVENLSTFAGDPAALTDALGDAVDLDGALEDAVGGALGGVLGGGGDGGGDGGDGGGASDAIGGVLDGVLGGGGSDDQGGGGSDSGGGGGLGGAVRGLFD